MVPSDSSVLARPRTPLLEAEQTEALKSGPELARDFTNIPTHRPASIRVQPKLTVGATNDPAEQEADRIADHVMRMPGPGVQSQAANSNPERSMAPAAQIQTKSMGASDGSGIAAPPIVQEVLSSPGQPLDAATRAFFEPRFGRDFSHVRVHDDTRAAESTASIAARAYTAGQHIAIGPNAYRPDTLSGLHLLAHELAHSLQASGAAHGKWDVPTVVTVKEGMTLFGIAKAHGTTVEGLMSLNRLTSTVIVPGQKLKIPRPGVTEPKNRSVAQEPTDHTLEAVKSQVLGSAKNSAKTSAAQEPSSPVSLWQRFCNALDRLDKSLVLDAEQGGAALQLYAKGTTNKGSTAAKPAKDVHFVGTIDLVELFEMFEIMTLAVSSRSEIFTTKEALKEEPLKVGFEFKEKIDAIKEALEEEEKREVDKKHSHQERGEEKAAPSPSLVQKVQELKNLAHIELAKAQTQAKAAAAKNMGAMQKPGKGRTPPQGESLGPYDRYYVEMEWVSGGTSDDPSNPVQIYWQRDGVGIMVEQWVNKAGYNQYKTIKKLKRDPAKNP